MSNEGSKGIIYILSNRAMPDCYKIGKCAQNGLQKRMRDLYSTGVPVPFECEYAKLVDNYDVVEKKLHFAFSPERWNDNREFFKTNPERIIAILDLLKGEDVTGTVRQRIDETTTDADRLAQNRARRPNLSFQALGIPDGAKITFLSPDDENATIQAEIKYPRQVVFNGQIMSLSSLTKQLLHVERDLRPAGYWAYNGRNLLDIYEETYCAPSAEE